jgi:hypothetical protein
MDILIFITMLLALFGLAFISRRRFGLLGLGLAAGTLLASQSLPLLEEFFQVFKQYLGGVSPAQAAAILLVLAPSLVLMLSGSKYHSGMMRLAGSLLYAVMAGFAILPFVLSTINMPDDVKNFVTTSHASALAIGVVIAVVDVFLTRHNKKS